MSFTMTMILGNTQLCLQRFIDLYLNLLRKYGDFTFPTQVKHMHADSSSDLWRQFGVLWLTHLIKETRKSGN